MHFVLSVLFFFIYNLTSSNENDLGNVVVSPNRSSIELDKVGSSFFLIEEDNIENSSATSTSSILQEFGSFIKASKGNKGADPSYFNRGLSRKYIKVLVDGMDLSDITSTQEEPTYIDNITLNNIDNIEILNGSQGTLYGGNAIGGVISINSALPEKKGYSSKSFVEGGSYGTVKTSNSIKYLNNDLSFVLNTDGERSTGYNSFIDTNLAPTEKDGYYLYGINFLSSIDLKDKFKLNLNGRFYKQHNEYDNNYTYPGDSLIHFRDDKASSLLLDIIYNYGNTSHKLSYQPTYTNRINTSGTSYEYDGKKTKIEYIISTKILGFYNLSGLEHLQKNANMSGTLAEKETSSLFTEFRFETKNTNFDLSYRKENDSNFGNFDTGRFQINYNLLRTIILKSSIGSGYRTPTPYELYSTYGNKSLNPESSLSYDAGADINLNKFNSNIYIGLFETKVEDLITYKSSKYRQSNISLKTNGLETRLKINIKKNLIAGINYTRTNGKENDGDSITLVPKDKLVAFFKLKSKKNILLNTYYQFHNKTKDTKYNELPAYRSLNINTNFPLNKKSKALFKIENLLDRNNILNRGGGTVENLGYKSPGLSIYFGIKIES